MHGSELSAEVSTGLGWYFLILAALNLYYSTTLLRAKRVVIGAAWAIFSVVILLGSSFDYFQGNGLILSQFFRDKVDQIMGPELYTILSIVGFAAIIIGRRVFASALVGWYILDATLILVGYSMTDKDFRMIVAKPDNVPISLLILSAGFTTWLSLRQAVINDDRIDKGEKPLESLESDKVLTWPDLVYTEMLAMIIFSVILVVWSVKLTAPLEPPASPTEIPNPSKAPWYFLGLQEMLVYFDPWLAGVVLPTYIIIGLCAIPYIDYNTKGNGYYTFKERPFAITTFMFGFLVLWVVLIVLGTFLRGPNWNFFGPYEVWSPDKTIAMNNINLSDLIWVDWFKTERPKFWLAREWPCILLVLVYFLLPPLLMAKAQMFRGMVMKMGLIRFMLMTNILLMMASLPIKMMARWMFNLKYVVFIPDYFFNV